MNTTVLDVNNKVSPSELNNIVNLMLNIIDNNPDMSSELKPLLIHGSPGIGKSSIIREICQSRGWEFIDVRLAQMEPCDIKGLPVANKEKHQMDWYVNSVWPRDPDSKGIIFLDEITSADKSIQTAAYELVLDRRLGSLYSVPKKWYIIAAGNNITDRASAVTMSSALANRFMHVELIEKIEDWLDWARSSNIHPTVIAFLQSRPNYLFRMENENLERGWPSPRSWAGVSSICHFSNNNIDDSIYRKMIYGLIGNSAGLDFISYFRLNCHFNNILETMIDPNSKIVIPDEPDQKYAMISSMVYLLWKGKDEDDTKKRINGFLRICIHLDSAFACAALSASINGNESERAYRARSLRNSPIYSKWREKHGKNLETRSNYFNNED